MKYICHRPFFGKSLSCSKECILCGTELTSIGRFLAIGNRAICMMNSENSHRHFARNDDGKGIERGNLTYAIAYGKRKRKHADGSCYRFSEEEIDMLVNNYGTFLKSKAPIWFNDKFFSADIEDLQELAGKLGIEAIKG